MKSFLKSKDVRRPAIVISMTEVLQLPWFFCFSIYCMTLLRFFKQTKKKTGKSCNCAWRNGRTSVSQVKISHTYSDIRVETMTLSCFFCLCDVATHKFVSTFYSPLFKFGNLYSCYDDSDILFPGSSTTDISCIICN